MSADFLVRYEGGPLDGEQKILNTESSSWPPPVYTGRTDGGVYRLVSFSKTPPEHTTEHLISGARYRWQAE